MKRWTCTVSTQKILTNRRPGCAMFLGSPGAWTLLPALPILPDLSLGARNERGCWTVVGGFDNRPRARSLTRRVTSACSLTSKLVETSTTVGLVAARVRVVLRWLPDFVVEARGEAVDREVVAASEVIFSCEDSSIAK